MKTIQDNFPARGRLVCAMALIISILAPPAHAQAPGLHIQLNEGRALLSITGLVNTYHAVQFTTDLSAPDGWQPLTNVLLATSPGVVEDATAGEAGPKFYRVVSTNSILTVTDAQLRDMCSRLCDQLATTNKIPETIAVGGQSTNSATAAEFHALMAKWLRHYRIGNSPPASVATVRGIQGPATPGGVESGTLYLTNLLAAATADADYIDAHGTLPNNSTVGLIQYATKAMLWVFARTINWYQDHNSTMPAFATVRAVAAPDSWPLIPPPAGIKVAVFTDPDGGSTTANCVNATINILTTNSGFNVSTITATAIRAGGLTNYDVVMFPGGGGTGQATALLETGCAQVEQFVARGGGFVGTCAGAYLAALGYNPQTAWLEIVDAQVIDVAHWNRGSGLVQIQIVNPTHPILAGFPEYVTAQYINGPLFGPGSSPSLTDYAPGAVFVTDIHDNGPTGIMPGTDCLTTSAYQSGRCVLFSFHPELSAGLEQLVVRAVLWSAGQL